MSTDACVIFCTVPNESTATALARGLVEERLAACVNVIPGLRSFYRWQGKLQDEQELLLLIKTSRKCVGDLQSWIARKHPYSTPEVIALPVEQAAQNYLSWLLGEVSR